MTKNERSNVKFISLFLIVIMLTVGCSGYGSANSIISISGSTSVLPIASKSAELFMKLNPGIKVIVNPGGSGVGVKSLASGLIDIGMISRNIAPDELKAAPDIDFRKHVIGKDAVACVVSSEIYDSGVTALSKKQIGAIYSGKIQNWKEVGGPDREILVIDKEASRGTRHVFMEFVFGDKNARAAGADLISGSNNEEQTKISLSDAAIGMLSHAWINDDVKGVSILVGDMIVEPTVENIRNGSYPISRDLTFITNGEPTGTVRQFINYLLKKESQKIVSESGYVPVK